MLRPDAQKVGQLLPNPMLLIQQNAGHARRGRPVTALEGHRLGDHLEHRIGSRAVGAGLEIGKPPSQGQIFAEFPEARGGLDHADLTPLPPRARARTAFHRFRRSMLSAR